MARIMGGSMKGSRELWRVGGGEDTLFWKEA